MSLPWRYTVTIRRRSTATLGPKGQRTKAAATTVATDVPADLWAQRQALPQGDDGRHIAGTWGFFVPVGTDLQRDDYLEVTAGPAPYPAQLHVVDVSGEGVAAEAAWDIHGTAEITSEVL